MVQGAERGAAFLFILHMQMHLLFCVVWHKPHVHVGMTDTSVSPGNDVYMELICCSE